MDLDNPKNSMKFIYLNYSQINKQILKAEKQRVLINIYKCW